MLKHTYPHPLLPLCCWLPATDLERSALQTVAARIGLERSDKLVVVGVVRAGDVLVFGGVICAPVHPQLNQNCRHIVFGAALQRVL